MAYMVELDVDRFGCLLGGEGDLPVKVIDHNWYEPYPTAQGIISVEWQVGEEGLRPSVFWHPQLRDWVCDRATYELLKRVAPGDVHLVAKGQLTNGEEVIAVQVVGLLDVVDRNASIIDKYPSYEILQFPAFFRKAADAISTRIFRVPGAFTKVFVGESIKDELDAAGVSGLRYVRVDWSD